MHADRNAGPLNQSRWRLLAKKADVDVYFVRAILVVLTGLIFGGGLVFALSENLKFSVGCAFIGAAIGSALAISLNQIYLNSRDHFDRIGSVLK